MGGSNEAEATYFSSFIKVLPQICWLNEEGVRVEKDDHKK